MARAHPRPGGRKGLRSALIAATSIVAAAGVFTAFAFALGSERHAAVFSAAPVGASAPGYRAMGPRGDMAAAAKDSSGSASALAVSGTGLDAAAAAVGFRSTVDFSAGNVEGLPADARLLPPSGSLLPVGTAAPDFTLSTPRGESVRLSAYKGKAVLLEFFATWCPHCQAEVPHLKSLSSALASSPVVFLSVNADSEDAASVYAFEKYFSLPWPALLDPGGQPGSFTRSGGFGTVTTAYGVALYPTFYIIDPDGRIAWRADREQPDALVLEKLKAASERR